MPVSSISQSVILLPRTTRQSGANDDIDADSAELGVAVATDSLSTAAPAIDNLDTDSTGQSPSELIPNSTVVPATTSSEANNRRFGETFERSSFESTVLEGLPITSGSGVPFISPLEKPSSTSQLAIDLYSRTQDLLPGAEALLEPGQVLVGVDIFV